MKCIFVTFWWRFRPNVNILLINRNIGGSTLVAGVCSCDDKTLLACVMLSSSQFHYSRKCFEYVVKCIFVTFWWWFNHNVNILLVDWYSRDSTSASGVCSSDDKALLACVMLSSSSIQCFEYVVKCTFVTFLVTIPSQCRHIPDQSKLPRFHTCSWCLFMWR